MGKGVQGICKWMVAGVQVCGPGAAAVSGHVASHPSPPLPRAMCVAA